MGDHAIAGGTRPGPGPALMAQVPIDPPAEEQLRLEAAEWFARMRSPDADRYRAAFESWIEAHPDHRAFYDRMALRWQQAGLVGHTDAGKQREGLPEPRPTAESRTRYYALAACLAAVIMIGVSAWLWSPSRSDGPAGRTEVAESAVTSPMGIRRVRLADGSLVTLDTDTSLTVRLTQGERRIVLNRGRARFEVAHDAGRPFIVSVGGDEVVALGTVFDVSLVSGRPRVSLFRGSVEVRHAPGAAPGGSRTIARLVPGQAIALAGSAPVPQSAPAADAAWVTGMLSFENAPLTDVLAAANRYSERKVTIDDPALGALKVTGTFRADHPDELAATLAAAFGLEVARLGDGLVLRRRIAAHR